MTKADKMQVGGQHYASEYQHWNMVIATGMGYLEGNATKYISRWRKKDGVKDLQKALHYIDKLNEAAASGLVTSPLHATVEVVPSINAEIAKFIVANSLFEREAMAITFLGTWSKREDLIAARRLVNSLIAELEQPVPLSDSNKHAERVKCLVSEGRAVDFAGNIIEDCRFPNCDCERSAPDPIGW